MKKTFHITTFGCQMNVHDSEMMAGMLLEKGFREARTREEADIVIINTCSVRENADKRFFGTLGQLKRRKLLNPGLIICVCGCMMQQKHITDIISDKYPWVDIIFGTHNIHRLPALIDNAMGGRKKQAEVWDESRGIVEGLPFRRLSKWKAFISIIKGCDNYCSYCIVPYTRGREISRRPSDILNEAKSLAADGVKEIMLLGQNVNSYRGCKNTDFTDLIHMLSKVEGIERIRFMTSHPKDMSPRLIGAFADCDKLCKNIHLPVQSGSSRILEKMNRKYTREQYLELIRRLREAAPDITVSTDIIVGFPGETEEDFEETLRLAEEVRYDSAFTFLYSVRKGTPAEKFGDQVPEEVKHRRFDRLVQVINRISAEKNALYRGRIEKVLVEGPSKKSEEYFTGRTDGFKLVNFKGTPDMEGKIIDVEITQGKTFSLAGRAVDMS